MAEVPTPTEPALVARARDGDAGAFELLVRRHTVALYRLAFRLTGHPATAEDVVQEAWVAAWRFLPRFDGRSAFSTWLYRLTTNAAFKAHRGRRAVPVEDGTLHARVPAAESGEAVAQRSAQRSAVRAAVADLPMALRAPIVLRYFEDRSVEETAEILGVTTATVRGRLQRGRAALGTALGGWV